MLVELMGLADTVHYVPGDEAKTFDGLLFLPVLQVSPFFTLLENMRTPSAFYLTTMDSLYQ